MSEAVLCALPDRRFHRSVVLALLVALTAGCGMSPPTVPSREAGTGTAPVFVRDRSFPDPSIPFDQVTWMEVDRETGEVYLLQRSQPPVSVWSSEGELLRTWSTRALGDPHSLTLHTDAAGQRSVWITDMAPPRYAGTGYGHCLKQFSLGGVLLRTVGTCGAESQGSGLDPVQFDRVTDVAFDAAGRLFVTDGDLDGLNNRLLKIAPSGEVVESWSAPGNQPGSGPGEFDLPHDVLVDPCGRKWVADALNHRIQVFTAGGEVAGEMACFGSDGVYGLALSEPRHPAGGGPVASLFVTTSPTTGGNRGTVHFFAAPMDCSRPAEVGACPARTSWPVVLPPTPTPAMLHAITTNHDGTAVYISTLGGELPPQKWVESQRRR